MALDPIPLERLAFALVPALAVVALMRRWKVGAGKALYAFARMFVQLLAIGYGLVYIFNADSALIVLLILAAMSLAASWIALNTVETGRRALLPTSLASMLAGGGVTLVFILGGVLQLDPWYAPHVVIPIAGMTFSSSMTAVSLAAERMQAELGSAAAPPAARARAFQTAMIPIINALFAVGLVALPGMMTGQILSGVSPLIAARYQIMVMCMMFSSAGLSTAAFLYLSRNLPVFAKTRAKE